MKKRKETKSEIVEKILTKYEVSLDELNYDALKKLKPYPILDKKEK